MIIQCGACGKRSKISAAKIPAKGAKVRCPACATLLAVPGGLSDDADVRAEPADGAVAANRPAAPPPLPPAANPAATAGFGFGDFGGAGDPFGKPASGGLSQGRVDLSDETTELPPSLPKAPAAQARTAMGLGELSEPALPAGSGLPWDDDLDVRESAAGRTQAFGTDVPEPIGPDHPARRTQMGIGAWDLSLGGDAAPGSAGNTLAPDTDDPFAGPFGVRTPAPPPPSSPPPAAELGDFDSTRVSAAGGGAVAGAGSTWFDAFGPTTPVAPPPPAAPRPSGKSTSLDDIFGGGLLGEPGLDERTSVSPRPVEASGFKGLDLGSGSGDLAAFLTQGGTPVDTDYSGSTRTNVAAPPPAAADDSAGGIADLFGDLGGFDRGDGGVPAGATPRMGMDVPRFADDTAESLLAGEEASLLDKLPDLGGSGLTLYRIRRSTGRIFGPFPAATVIDMLRAGKLSGDEDVSSDGESYLPLVEVPEFALEVSAWVKGMGQAAPAGGYRAGFDAGAPELVDERRRLEEEQRRRSAQDLFRTRSAVKRPARSQALMYAGLGLAAVAALAMGLFLLTGQLLGDSTGEETCLRVECLSAPRRELLNEVEKLVGNDTFADSEKAVHIIDEELRKPPFPGRAALESVAAGLRWLHIERFGPRKAWDDEAVQSLDALVRALPPEQPPERLLYFAKGVQALAQGKREDARSMFQLMSRGGSGPDVLAGHLIALSFVGTPQAAQGTKSLQPILDSDKRAALTYYLAGRIAAAGGDMVQAQANFKAALDLNPKHVDAKLESLTIDIGDPTRRERVLKDLEALRADMNGFSALQQGRVHFLLAGLYCDGGQSFKCVGELKKAIAKDARADSYRERLARFYFGRWELDDAVEEYKACIGINAKNEACQIGAVRVYIARGQLLKAQEALRGADTALPRSPEVAYYWGQAHEQNKNLPEALKRYEEAIGLRKSVSYLVAAARVYHAQGDEDKYAEYVQQARALDDAHPEIHLLLGNIAAAAGNLADAQREYTDVVTKYPENVDGRLALGQVFRKKREFPAALAEFERVLKIDERSWAARDGLGDTYYDMGGPANVEKAMVEYEAARGLVLKPNADLHFKLGMTYFLQKRWEDARSEFNKSLALDAASDRSAYYIARVLMEQENYEKARDFFEDALNIRKEPPPEYYYWLGMAHFALTQHQQALEQYQKALSHTREGCYAEALMYQGIVQRLLNDHALAFKSLRAAVKCNEDLALAHKALAEMYATAPRGAAIEDALRHAKAYERMVPGDWKGHEILAVVYQRQRKWAQSTGELRKALALNRDQCSLHREIGYNEKQLGAVGPMRDAFNAYLRCACDGPAAADDCRDIRNLLSIY